MVNIRGDKRGADSPRLCGSTPMGGVGERVQAHPHIHCGQHSCRPHCKTTDTSVSDDTNWDVMVVCASKTSSAQHFDQVNFKSKLAVAYSWLCHGIPFQSQCAWMCSMRK